MEIAGGCENGARLVRFLHRLGTHDVFRQAHHFHRADHFPRHVVLEPSVSVGGAAGFRVMVVVPTFTVAQ